jgi:hypothetical protein
MAWRSRCAILRYIDSMSTDRWPPEIAFSWAQLLVGLGHANTELDAFRFMAWGAVRLDGDVVQNPEGLVTLESLRGRCLSTVRRSDILGCELDILGLVSGAERFEPAHR